MKQLNNSRVKTVVACLACQHLHLGQPGPSAFAHTCGRVELDMGIVYKSTREEKARAYGDTSPFIYEIDEKKCRVCGCSENNPCIHVEHGTCWWVEEDLCSHCKNWPGKSVLLSEFANELINLQNPL